MRALAGLSMAAVLLVTGGTALPQEQPQAVLDVAIVVRITSPPLFTEDAGRSTAVDDLGPIAEAVDRIGAVDADVALAPSPVFCDELALANTDVADGVLGAIRTAGGPTLLQPYAEVRLADLTDADAVTDQLVRGRRALAACTQRPPADILFPPDVAIDREALDATAAMDIVAALSPLAVAQAQRDVVLLPTVEIEGGASVTDVLEATARTTDPVIVVDTSAIDVVEMLAADARVAIRPIGDLVDDAPELGFPLPTGGEGPPHSYEDAISDAAAALDDFRRYTRSNNRTVAIFATVLARARSSAAWDDDWDIGRARAAALERAIAAEQDLIDVEEGDVTFTSRRGSVPITVSNGASYPVRVRVSVASSKLDFPGGSEQAVTVQPPGDTVTFEALARSTGTFPMQVTVTSPDTSIVLASGRLSVRSVAANVAAIVLTAGGALVLLGWVGQRVRRRRAAAR